ncbi:hypothetical protein [Neptuniibacter sp.]|uniref:hypothetical protein n=1 Tax=Neptuniibacter sp. TaxID=1962643 RepID=UPI003B5BBFC5
MLRKLACFIVLLTLSTFSSAETTTPHYVMQDGKDYGWEDVNGNVYMAAFLGERNGIYQFVLSTNDTYSEVAIIKPPYEYFTLAKFYKMELIKRNVQRLRETSIANRMLQDAKAGHLKNPRDRHPDRELFHWVDEDYTVQKLARKEFTK